MEYRYAIILYLVNQFRGERTISGIYHLLKGKKSSQSIQDSFLFHVEPFFHSCEDLDRRDFKALIDECMSRRWISSPEQDSQRYVLSSEGERVFSRLDGHLLTPEGLNFTEQVNEESRFWLKLQLMVQTLSALLYNQRAFLPITRQPSVTESVRRCIMEASLGRSKLASHFYHELVYFLQRCPASEAELLTAQLTGYKMSGLTVKQIAELTGKDEYECRILFKSALRRLMKEIAEFPIHYPYTGRLLIVKKSALSLSAEETLKRIRSGLSLHEVAKKRRLSQSTVEDHLVEIALKDRTIDMSNYLSDRLEKQILEAASEAKTKQLKPIKKLLLDRASYFQIRLALAKEAVRRGEDPNGTTDE